MAVSDHKIQSDSLKSFLSGKKVANDSDFLLLNIEKGKGDHLLCNRIMGKKQFP